MNQISRQTAHRDPGQGPRPLSEGPAFREGPSDLLHSGLRAMSPLPRIFCVSLLKNEGHAHSAGLAHASNFRGVANTVLRSTRDRFLVVPLFTARQSAADVEERPRDRSSRMSPPSSAFFAKAYRRRFFTVLRIILQNQWFVKYSPSPFVAIGAVFVAPEYCSTNSTNVQVARRSSDR